MVSVGNETYLPLADHRGDGVGPKRAPVGSSSALPRESPVPPAALGAMPRPAIVRQASSSYPKAPLRPIPSNLAISGQPLPPKEPPTSGPSFAASGTGPTFGATVEKPATPTEDRPEASWLDTRRSSDGESESSVKTRETKQSAADEHHSPEGQRPETAGAAERSGLRSASAARDRDSISSVETEISSQSVRQEHGPSRPVSRPDSPRVFPPEIRTASPTTTGAVPSTEQLLRQQEEITQQIGLVHRLMTNIGTGPLEGWAANILNAGARDGGVTFLTTALREVIGKLTAHQVQHAPESLKVAVSGTLMSAVGMLNGLTLLAQHVRGEANWKTRSAQVFNIALLASSATIAETTGALGKVLPLLVKATGYALSRDSLNLVFQLHDNRSPEKGGMSGRDLFTQMLVYGVNQIIVSQLQSYAGAYASSSDQSVTKAFLGLAMYCAANAAGEATHALVGPAITAFYDGLGDGLRAALKNVQDVRLSTSLHIPFGKDVVNNWAKRKKWTQHDVVGDVTRYDVWRKATGEMLARETLFMGLYALSNMIGKVGPAAHFNEEGSTLLANVLFGLSLGLMVASFIGMVSASPPRARPRDLETGLAGGSSNAPGEPGAIELRRIIRA